MNFIKFETIKKFMATYFHQDWKDEYNSINEAIDEFGYSGDLNHRTIFLEELELLIDCAKSGELLESDLHSKFCCYFIPSRNDLSLVSWLEYINIRVSEILKERAKK